MKEISINEIENIAIGQVEDVEGATGCTAFISKEGMSVGMDVRGGGPASRESGLLDPLTQEHDLHGVVLAGGSAYGLQASGGVLKCLEERGIGYDVGGSIVPLVVQSDIFDLKIGKPGIRPDEEMGYRAAEMALDSPNYRDGIYGAGCGATVGKIRGMDTCMKSGMGSYAVQIGNLKIGAVVVVNAWGDVFNWRTGEKIAGLLNEDKKSFGDSMKELQTLVKDVENKFTGNTTLGVVITNGKFDKRKLCKIAGMGQDGLARSIRPVHTSADGDTVYAVSVGDVEADQDLVGTMAAEVISEAITRAIEKAESAYGHTAARDLF